jgi:hypothetical protein
MPEEPSEKPAGTADCDKEEASFFKGTTASTLAKAIFKDRFSVGAAKEFAGNDGKQLRCSVGEVISLFQAHHLEVADPLTTKWTASDLSPEDGGTVIPQQQVGLRRHVRFCCQRCKNNNVWSLLAVGECVKTEEGCVTEMQKVFHHDKDCSETKKEKVPTRELEVFDFDLQQVIGTACDSVVESMSRQDFADTHPAGACPGALNMSF